MSINASMSSIKFDLDQFDKELQQTIPDKSHRIILSQFVLNLLHKKVTRKLIIFRGTEDGCNGKSTIIETIKKIIEDNTTISIYCSADHPQTMIRSVLQPLLSIDNKEWSNKFDLTRQLITTKSFKEFISYSISKEIIPICNVILKVSRKDIIPEDLLKIGTIIDFPYSFFQPYIKIRLTKVLKQYTSIPIPVIKIISSYF